MKFGLNIPKKKNITNKPSSRPSKVFQEDEGEEEDNIHTVSTKELEKLQKHKINKLISKNSSVAQKKLKEAHEKALKEDPNIFDYDAVYDDLKEAEERKNRIAREREAEGDQYNDKEVFMTESYKKQKAELERIEAEERQREEEAAKRSNMNIFYKQLLDKKDKERNDILKASKEMKSTVGTPKLSKDQKTEEEKVIIDEAKQKGIQLNDSNEIVDKRDLLGAGLNIAKKPKFGTFASLASLDDRIKERQEEYDAYKKRKMDEYNAKRKHGSNLEEREKLSKEIERQLVEVKQKEEQKVLEKHQSLQKSALTRRTTKEVALNARERYLARKKQKTKS
ncbi:unnamed protein product [Cunninghamella blakesleeana]